MIIDIGQSTAHDVARHLVEIRERHGAIALGRVLTLVVVVDEALAEWALTVTNAASHEHPSRVIAVVRGSATDPTGLDAEVRIGGDAGSGEIVVLRVAGALTTQPASVVGPLLLPDTPIVAWWPGVPPAEPASDPVGQLAQRRITNVAACAHPVSALQERMAGYTPGDTDLAWSRITTWRALLASALDQPPYSPVTAARVEGNSDSASVDLLAGWLALALDRPVRRVKLDDAIGVARVELVREDGSLLLERPPGDTATLTIPGRAPRSAALARRHEEQCLAEELRRLDPDELYGDVLRRGLRALADNGSTVSAGMP